ncbi:winged helix-turn-helix domain-containing protein [Enterococcus devriesei]|uniref:winged helix-turn-helix domain-containing protein n=1 Tax=Enterococcus devriesei TaxID=319970 RepID=UPI001C10C679|nr:winged helix-turn-helix domain-containing protein [Enterococcus devriesei]MBU5365106.1 winged helix-turn-helix domain-containing protein [Enterococcus devriesei]
MCQILILTKNILAEQPIQEKLQHLNHEVYCSQKICHSPESLLQAKNFVNQFDCLIVSETLSQEEYQLMSTILRQQGFETIFRKGDAYFAETESASESNETIWLSMDSSLEELRELLQVKVEGQSKSLKASNYSLTHRLKAIKFTRLEERLLIELGKDAGVCISRNELCKRVWHSEETKSHLAQLSNLIQRIKTKMENAGIQEEILKTYWKRGYQLDERLINYSAA